MTEWRLLDSWLLGGTTPKRWSGRFVTAGSDPGDALQVTIDYGGNAAAARRGAALSAKDGVERLGEMPLQVTGLGETTLAALVEDIPSLEAVHPPPVTLRFSLVLSAADGLTIEREDSVRMEEHEFRPADPLRHLHRLSSHMRSGIDALRAGDERAAAGLPIVALARWLATRDGPLSPPHEEIGLVSLAVDVAGRPGEATREVGEAPVEHRPGLGWVAHLPGAVIGEIVLLPEFRYLRHLPFLDRIETEEHPLPSHALVRLSGEYDRTLAWAEPEPQAGRFRLSCPGDRVGERARLEAVYPLEPPGDEPRLTVELRRPVEEETAEEVATPAPDGPGGVGDGIPREVVFSHPEQRIVVPWGDGDGTGEVLGEIRRLYKAALQRGIEEIAALEAPAADKAARMEDFLDQWRDHLFATHKGGWLQDFEGQLDQDRKEALQRVSDPG